MCVHAHAYVHTPLARVKLSLIYFLLHFFESLIVFSKSFVFGNFCSEMMLYLHSKWADDVQA